MSITQPDNNSDQHELVTHSFCHLSHTQTLVALCAYLPSHSHGGHLDVLLSPPFFLSHKSRAASPIFFLMLSRIY